MQDDESAFPEGKKKYKIHFQRERDSSLVRNAKAVVLEREGKIACEACGFDFEKTYGDLGAGYIEAHHKVPVSEIDGRSKTKVKDLVMVCSNCHRMLHRSKETASIEKLKKLLAQHRAV